jgi:hypothetical protein
MPDEACSRPLRQDLYNAHGSTGYIAESFLQSAYGDHHDLAAELARTVETIRSTSAAGESFTLDPEQQRKLKALGYAE